MVIRLFICAFCLAFSFPAFAAEEEIFQIPLDKIFPSLADYASSESRGLSADETTTGARGASARGSETPGDIPPAFPDPSLRAKNEEIGYLLVSQIAPAPNSSKARNRQDREKELTDFLNKIPDAFARHDTRIASAIRNHNWVAAHDDLAARLRSAPESQQALGWLFMKAEFLYRAMMKDKADPQDVLEAFRTFIYVTPDDYVLAPYAYYRLAQVSQRVGLPAQELAYIASTRAGKDTPFDDLFMIHQAQAIIAWNRPGEARALLNTLLRLYPNSPVQADAEYLLGEIAWNEGSELWKVASYRHFRNMLDLTTSPLVNSPSRICIAAKSLIFNKHPEEAKPLLNWTLSLPSKTFTPAEGEACLLLAECLYNEGRLKEAIPWFERGENKILPRRIRLTASLSLAQIGYNQSRQEKSAPLSQSYSYQKPVEAAKRVFQEATDSELGAGAGYLWGRILAEQGNLDEAVRAFMIVSRQYPQSPLASQFKDLIASYFKDAIEQAYLKEDYKTILHFFSANAQLATEIDLDRPTRDRHASALLKMGYYTEAANIWRRLRGEKNPDGTIPDTPPPDELLLHLAESLQKSKQPAEALQVLRERVKQYPDSDMGAETLIRARCYMDSSDQPRAVNALEQVLDSASVNQENKLLAYEMLANIYKEQEQWGNAELILQKGLYQMASDGRPLAKSEGARRLVSGLAGLYYSQHQAQSAIVMYTRYLDLYPSAPDAAMSLFRLGQMFQQAENFDEAQAAYKRLADGAVNDPLYKELAKTSLADLALQQKMEKQEKKK